MKTNLEILKAFEQACFRITNYPNNKKYNAKFSKLELEIAHRLNLTNDEIKKLKEE